MQKKTCPGLDPRSLPALFPTMYIQISRKEKAYFDTFPVQSPNFQQFATKRCFFKPDVDSNCSVWLEELPRLLE